MPTIYFNDGSSKRTGYSQAAQVNMYLDEPDKLDQIRDPEERAKKEAFLLTVKSLDFSDIDRKMNKNKPIMRRSPEKAENKELKRVLADKSLTGKARFDAVRRAMTGKGDDVANDNIDF